jgi:2-polyprenyl-3-methyl-5-hydroxy-6-metoxy-1,4-benzoquinol methylase
MINRLHALLYRPEAGWDPVPADHVKLYANAEWASGVRQELLDELDRWVGGLAGKRVLDLGGGPGHYSVAFAKRNAQVTWYDISQRYKAIAEQRARENGVELQFGLGYLDEAPANLRTRFDLVFNRICWNYGWHDFSFAKVVYSLVTPGGVGYVDTTHSDWHRDSASLYGAARNWLNDNLAIKIGHPFPPHGRIATLFSKLPMERVVADYSLHTNDRVLFVKASADGPGCPLPHPL